MPFLRRGSASGGGGLVGNGTTTFTSPITDLTKVIPKQALPTLPSKGGKFYDPTFVNVQIMRVTDATDGTGTKGTTYSYWGSFNHDESRFIILDADISQVFYDFDPVAFTLGTRRVVTGKAGKYTEGTWHPTNPAYIYAPANAGGGPKICRLDFTTPSSPVETVLADFSGVSFGGQTVLSTDYFGQALFASDMDRFSTSWFDSGYNGKGYLVGKISTGTLLLIKADTTVDECNITRDGLYLHATWGPPGQATTGYRNVEYRISDGAVMGGFLDNPTDLSVGHHVPYGSGSQIVGAQDYVNQLVSYSLASPATKSTVHDYGSGTDNFSLSDLHLSTTAIDQSELFIEQIQSTTQNTNLYLVGEIWSTPLDGSATGKRMFHHRSMTLNNDYYSQPRGNVSPSKKFYIFSSNMDNAGGRIDCYIAKLP
jgi:hypothetical protein